ncbi:conjugative transposon protein TraM [Thalassobellus suaedae]|uniref:Conjugative transposon protein TraM n=1 Tax=Thalassobellus suaedae TaxID=3074124 RepID=A0ABY9Y1M4_9FLAO|nr:conjugative transposon protein TraM [Flavobacteriaceae bacterium HL-DH10]
MKIEKNKIVFGSVLAVILIFLISYSVLLMGDDEKQNDNLKQTQVPELEQEQENYTSKLKAIDDLKEVRETNAPSIYDEKLIDSLGFYDPDLLEKDKIRIVDSIYNLGRINYTENQYRETKPKTLDIAYEKKTDSIISNNYKTIAPKEIGLEHQLFFASNPKKNTSSNILKTDSTIYVVVNGNQIVKKDFRLKMRLEKDAIINNQVIPKNTAVYGFISFKPNRVIIDIENILHQPVKLKAFDFQDGSEGVYVENNFRADATSEVIEDAVDDINIAGVPQVTGVKKIFQRSNRQVKVTIVNNYKLILKPQL